MNALGVLETLSILPRHRYHPIFYCSLNGQNCLEQTRDSAHRTNLSRPSGHDGVGNGCDCCFHPWSWNQSPSQWCSASG